MVQRLMVMLFFILIFLLLEVYTFGGFKSIWFSSDYWLYIQWAYVLHFFFLIYGILILNTSLSNGDVVRSTTANFWLGVLLTSTISKLIFCCALLLQDGGRMAIGVYRLVESKFIEDAQDNFIPSRRSFLNNAALAIAGIPLASMLYGMAKGKYRYTVKNISVAFSHLPKTFDGFRIVQISDVHAGSFDDIEEVRRGIAMVNEQKADLLLFTGDLVNSQKDEINPYIEIFSQLTAKHGKYAVLGNHDYYGLYGEPEHKKESYWNDFMSKFEAMGFRLLNNERVMIAHNGDQICLAGVENWGAGRHFPKHGDLNLTLEGLDNDIFTVLMSHDPSHWDHHVLPHVKKVDLTLSGHTHGMQFGIDMPGFKWSPVKYRYPRWMGLYEEAGQYLYVNKGFGFLGFPGRVGMWPEITVIELKAV